MSAGLDISIPKSALAREPPFQCRTRHVFEHIFEYFYCTFGPRQENIPPTGLWKSPGRRDAGGTEIQVDGPRGQAFPEGRQRGEEDAQEGVGDPEGVKPYRLDSIMSVRGVIHCDAFPRGDHGDMRVRILPPGFAVDTTSMTRRKHMTHRLIEYMFEFSLLSSADNLPILPPGCIQMHDLPLLLSLFGRRRRELARRARRGRLPAQRLVSHLQPRRHLRHRRSSPPGSRHDPVPAATKRLTTQHPRAASALPHPGTRRGE